MIKGLKVIELRKLAKEFGIKGYSKMKKSEIIEAIDKMTFKTTNKDEVKNRLDLLKADMKEVLTTEGMFEIKDMKDIKAFLMTYRLERNKIEIASDETTLKEVRIILDECNIDIANLPINEEEEKKAIKEVFEKVETEKKEKLSSVKIETKTFEKTDRKKFETQKLSEIVKENISGIKTFKKCKTLNDCLSDPRVDEIEIDKAGSWNINPYMIFLKAGYRVIDEIRHIDSFENVKDLCYFLNEMVVPCDCEECKEILKRGN